MHTLTVVRHSFQYWAVIASLFEDIGPEDRASLVLQQGQSVGDIILEARCNFEILVRMYYLRHGFDMYNTWVFFFLNNLCFMAIRELQVKYEEGANQDTVSMADDKAVAAARSTLVLASKGISDQGRCYYLAEAMLRTICIQMDPMDVGILKQYARFQDIDDPVVTAERLKVIKSSWQHRVASNHDPEKKSLQDTVEGEDGKEERESGSDTGKISP